MSFLDEAIEDAVISMSEDGIVPPSNINIFFSEKEWVGIERFHRLRKRRDGKLGIIKDRYPFIRIHVLGIAVNLFPEPKHIETVH